MNARHAGARAIRSAGRRRMHPRKPSQEFGALDPETTRARRLTQKALDVQ
jgi:hypothetical protein